MRAPKLSARLNVVSSAATSRGLRITVLSLLELILSSMREDTEEVLPLIDEDAAVSPSSVRSTVTSRFSETLLLLAVRASN